MPFIWNDKRAEYADASGEFDRNEFVVVRKLFIQFKDDAKMRRIHTIFVVLYRAIVTVCSLRTSPKVGYNRNFKTTAKLNTLRYSLKRTAPHGHILRFSTTNMPMPLSPIYQHPVNHLKSKKYCRQIVGASQRHQAQQKRITKARCPRLKR